jgi:hypothetical protein
MFTAMSRGAASARTMRHFRPAGKPAPPKPRSADDSSSASTASTDRLPFTQSCRVR